MVHIPSGRFAVLTGKGAEMVRNVFDMAFAKVFPRLIAKAERKGRKRDEVLLVTSWMTGYSPFHNPGMHPGDFRRNSRRASYQDGIDLP